MKNTLIRLLRRTLSFARKFVVKIPVLKRLALFTKNALFVEFSSNRLENYQFQNHYPSVADHMSQIKKSKFFKHRPLISIVMPTYNTPESFLRECIESVQLQSYDNWQLCIADDASTNTNVVKIIKEYADKDSRIILVKRPKNGHISAATNSAIEVAKGEFISLLDHDDVLWPNALFEVASVINEHPDVDLIYTDEDKIDGLGTNHSYPFLKPDFSPEFLESCNYITHFSTIRTSLIRDISGFTLGTEGAQDWDLFIRIAEKTSQVIHIPKILYSWRIHEDSTAANTDAKPYVYDAQLKLLNDHLKRTKRLGLVETGIITQHRTIKYTPRAHTSTAVIMSCSNFIYTLESTKALIKNRTGNFVDLILLVDKEFSASEQKQLSKASNDSRMRSIIRINGRVNYKEILDATECTCLFFVDDELSVLTKGWDTIGAGDSQIPGVGLVGPLILMGDKNTIASAGLGLGYGAEGVLDMLQGVSFEDPHYTRGLYAKSRRNVSSVSGVAYFIERQILTEALSINPNPTDVLELAVILIQSGKRQIYTPYIKFSTNGNLPNYKLKSKFAEDKFLNPNFNHDNPLMEVKL